MLRRAAPVPPQTALKSSAAAQGAVRVVGYWMTTSHSGQLRRCTPIGLAEWLRCRDRADPPSMN